MRPVSLSKNVDEMWFRAEDLIVNVHGRTQHGMAARWGGFHNVERENFALVIVVRLASMLVVMFRTHRP